MIIMNAYSITRNMDFVRVGFKKRKVSTNITLVISYTHMCEQTKRWLSCTADNACQKGMCGQTIK